jgi:signal transduction histidine kinase
MCYSRSIGWGRLLKMEIGAGEIEVNQDQLERGIKGWAVPDEGVLWKSRGVQAMLNTHRDTITWHEEALKLMEEAASSKRVELTDDAAVKIRRMATKISGITSSWKRAAEVAAEVTGDNLPYEVSQVLGHELGTGTTVILGYLALLDTLPEDPEAHRIARLGFFTRSHQLNQMQRLPGLVYPDEENNEATDDKQELTPAQMRREIKERVKAWEGTGVDVNLYLPAVEVFSQGDAGKEPSTSQVVGGVVDEILINGYKHGKGPINIACTAKPYWAASWNQAKTTKDFGQDKIIKRAERSRGCVLKGNQIEGDNLMFTQGFGVGRSLMEKDLHSVGAELTGGPLPNANGKVRWMEMITY